MPLPPSPPSHSTDCPARGVCCGTLRLWVPFVPEGLLRASQQLLRFLEDVVDAAQPSPDLHRPRARGPERAGHRLYVGEKARLCVTRTRRQHQAGRPKRKFLASSAMQKKLENSMTLPQKAAKGNAAKKALFDLKVCVKHCRARRSGGAAATISATQTQTSACLQHHT